MLTVPQIAAALKDRRLDLVSEATGLHRNTVMKYRDGLVENPSLATVQKLSDYIESTLPGAEGET
jgi:transcriptional regulator with XRE-family HTH domain